MDPDDDKLKVVAKQILKIRAYGEKDQDIKFETDTGCALVLLLLDNATDLLAKLLTIKLEKAVSKEQIKFKHVMVILLYIVNSFGLEKLGNEYVSTVYSDTIATSSTVCIVQELSLREKGEFHTKLTQFTNQNQEDIQHMLSFVIIAEQFKPDSKYVKNVVHNSLKDMKLLYANELKLLLYLSVLKYYINLDLPASTCFKIAFPKFSSLAFDKGWIKLSPQSRLFLKDRMKMDRTIVANCKMIGVNHEPVAFQLMANIMTSNCTRDQVVSEMINNETLMSTKSAMRDYIHRAITNLLVKRWKFIEKDEDSNPVLERTKFSQIIQDILASANGRYSAIELLKLGFSKLQKQNKHSVAQTLARLYIDGTTENEDIKNAKYWAFKGKELKPTLFTMADTVGRVFKKEAWSVTQMIHLNFQSFTHKYMSHSQDASDQFKFSRIIFLQ